MTRALVLAGWIGSTAGAFVLGRARSEAVTAPAVGALQTEQWARAQAYVERATADGVWTREEASGLHPLITELDDERRAHLLSSLFKAANDGRFRVERSVL